MAYFSIVNDTYFVNGKNGGAIYNLRSGEILPLDLETKHFLISCETLSINDSINKTGITQENAFKIMKSLVEKSIGIISTQKIYIDKYEYIRDVPGVFPPISLNSLFLDANSSCEFNCTHCLEPNYYFNYKCNSCIPWNKTSINKTKNNYKDILNQFEYINIRNAFISGGNPFTDLNNLKDICLSLSNIGIKNIYIITNGYTLEKDASKKFLKDTNAHPIITLIGYNDETYHYRTRTKNSFSKIKNGVKELEINNLNYSFNFSIFINEQLSFQEQYNKYNNTFQNANNTYTFYTEINDKPKFINLNKISPTNQVQFYMKQRYHSCLSFNLSIDSLGNILPCPHIRKLQFGNIFKNNMESIFINTRLQKLWTLTKDKIVPCKDCEYRYTCSDCKVSELEVTKTTTCTYNAGESM